MSSCDDEQSIGEKEVLHCAHLARLELSDGERDQFTGELARILDYVNVLREIDTSGIEATFFIIPSFNVMRDDRALPSMAREDMLMNAPSTEDAYIKMPRIMGND